MRTQGTLVKWNDDRGFGFARTRESGVEVFVHISEFPRSGRRPQMGDPLSFEIRTGHDGRKQGHAITWDVPLPPTDFMRAPPPAASRMPASDAQASHALYAQARPASRNGTQAHGRDHAKNRARAARQRRSAMPAIIVLTVGSALGWYFGRPDVPPAAPEAISSPALAPSPAPSIVDPQPAYQCKGRTHCSQMASCEEATWVLNHCPGTEMDGDHDGVPCEQQWCG